MGNIMQLEHWKMGMRNHDKDVQSRNRNEQRIYSLVLGQCSQALCNRITRTGPVPMRLRT
jgi:hypothetical protein